jgi:ABC-2 type transport system ATP-binding protein
MASHLLDEVEKVCTHVAVLKRGTLLVTGSVQEAFGTEHLLEVGAPDLSALQDMATRIPGVNHVSAKGELLLLSLAEAATASSVNRFCFDQGIVLTHLNLKKKSLESQFMELTKGGGVL